MIKSDSLSRRLTDKKWTFEVQTRKNTGSCKAYSTFLINIPLSLCSKCLQLSLPAKTYLNQHISHLSNLKMCVV